MLRLFRLCNIKGKDIEIMKITKRLISGTALVLLLVLLNAVCAYANTSQIHGHLDSVEGNTISGWLWDPSAPDKAQDVTVTVTEDATGEVKASLTATANQYRSDLKAQGVGTGEHGFHVVVDWALLPDSAYTIRLSSGDSTLSRVLKYSAGSCYEEDEETEDMVALGNFRLTAYCPCYRCSEGWGRRTSSGALASAKHTVAVDPRVIPIGSRLMINGVEYVAEDIGGAVKGNHIDVYYNTHAETLQHGTTTAEVYLIM